MSVGSFNTQCSLTGFSIGEIMNSRMVIIPIIQQTAYSPSPIYKQPRPRRTDYLNQYRKLGADITTARGSSHSNCHADAWWEPVILPIHGKYADRYMMNPDTDEFNLKRLKTLVNYIADYVYNSEAPDYEFDASIPLKLFNEKKYNDAMEYITYGAHCGQMFVKNYSRNVVELQLAAFSESAYDNANTTFPWMREKHTIDELYYAGHKEILEQQERRKKFDLNGTFVEYSIQAWGTYSGSQLGDVTEFYGYARENFDDKILVADCEKYKAHIVPFIRCAMAIAMMNRLWKSIFPLKYTGQEWPIEVANEILEFLTPLRDKLVEEYKREFGEDY
jgi:hypothetical protein